MENEEPKGTNEEPSGGQKDAGASTSPRPTLLRNSWDQIRKHIPAAASGKRTVARVLLMLVAAITAALVLLWIVDKIVFYYLAESYVAEVANVLDLNEHLANALVIFTFVVAVFFGSYIWSFSKQKRLFGIAGISALLIGHSLLLWYGTRGEYFERSGKAIKCYVLSREGQVTYGERPGIDPATGRLCRSVTPEMLERLKEYAKGKRPQQITDSNPTFFDPRTGEPIVWYYRSKDNKVEIFDLMGFQPDTGDELLPITKDVVDQWKTQFAQRTRHVPKLVDPEKYVFFDPLSGEALSWYWRDSNGSYEFYDSPGFQPQTGDKLLVATRQVVDDWKKGFAKRENAPQLIDPDKYPFFDPVTGAAQVWYWRGNNGAYEFYSAPGFHPQTGDRLLVVTPDVVAKWKQAKSPPTPKSSSLPSGMSTSVPQNSGLQLRQRTAEFLDTLYRAVSSSNNDAFVAFSGDYANQVSYFGKSYSREQVIAELQGFNNRWPIRQYVMRQDTLEIDCNELALTCTATGLLDFDARSPARNQRSWGLASFQYVLKFASSTTEPRIIQEAGEVKARNLEPLPYPGPLAPNMQTPSAGIPPAAAGIIRGLLGGVPYRR